MRIPGIFWFLVGQKFNNRQVLPIGCVLAAYFVSPDFQEIIRKTDFWMVFGMAYSIQLINNLLKPVNILT